MGAPLSRKLTRPVSLVPAMFAFGISKPNGRSARARMLMAPHPEDMGDHIRRRTPFCAIALRKFTGRKYLLSSGHRAAVAGATSWAEPQRRDGWAREAEMCESLSRHSFQLAVLKEFNLSQSLVGLFTCFVWSAQVLSSL